MAKKRPLTSGTCHPAIDPIELYAEQTIIGEQFPPNIILGFSVNGSVGAVGTDANGGFSRKFDAVWEGLNTVQVFNVGDVKSCTFTVE